MTGPVGEPPSEQAVAAAARLRVDAATAEVLRALDGARIRSRLLKGAALADWYASDPTWSYLDCDLWIHPDDLPAAEQELERLGFVRDFDERSLPEWWREHAASWSRASDATVVDLHRTLQGLSVDAWSAWELLCSSTDVIEVGGYSAFRLPVAARTLYVTLHAAHHGQAWGKALIHLERALEAVEKSAWREASELADRLNASDEFVAGLGLLPQGVELSTQLELRTPSSVAAVLHAQTPPPTALGFAQLAGATGVRARVAILAHKLFPPPAFIRHWWPLAQRSRAMLALGYLYRPVWLMQSARRGLPAWRRARKQIRDRPPGCKSTE